MEYFTAIVESFLLLKSMSRILKDKSLNFPKGKKLNFENKRQNPKNLNRKGVRDITKS